MKKIYNTEKKEDLENRLLRMQNAKQDANSLRLHNFKTVGQSMAIQRVAVERRRNQDRVKNAKNSQEISENDSEDDEDYNSEHDEDKQNKKGRQ